MPSRARTVDAYLAELPEDRREALEIVRAVIRENLDEHYAEGIQYGMIGYYVPHSVFPAGYHCDPRQPLPFAGLASQKRHMSLHLMCVHGSSAHAKWFREAWVRTGKKLDMGKACIRFKKLDDVPLEVVGEAFRRVPARAWAAHYQSLMDPRTGRPRSSRRAKGGGGAAKAKAKGSKAASSAPRQQRRRK